VKQTDSTKTDFLGGERGISAVSRLEDITLQMVSFLYFYAFFPVTV